MASSGRIATALWKGIFKSTSTNITFSYLKSKTESYIDFDDAEYSDKTGRFSYYLRNLMTPLRTDQKQGSFVQSGGDNYGLYSKIQSVLGGINKQSATNHTRQKCSRRMDDTRSFDTTKMEKWRSNTNLIHSGIAMGAQATLLQFCLDELRSPTICLMMSSVFLSTHSTDTVKLGHIRYMYNINQTMEIGYEIFKDENTNQQCLPETFANGKHDVVKLWKKTQPSVILDRSCAQVLNSGTSAENVERDCASHQNVTELSCTQAIQIGSSDNLFVKKTKGVGHKLDEYKDKLHIEIRLTELLYGQVMKQNFEITGCQKQNTSNGVMLSCIEHSRGPGIKSDCCEQLVPEYTSDTLNNKTNPSCRYKVVGHSNQKTKRQNEKCQLRVHVMNEFVDKAITHMIFTDNIN